MELMSIECHAGQLPAYVIIKLNYTIDIEKSFVEFPAALLSKTAFRIGGSFFTYMFIQ